MDFWTRLDETIKARGLSRKQVAKMLNINVSNFASWKSRENLPASRVLMALARLLSVDVGYLLYGKERLTEDEADTVIMHQNGDSISLMESWGWESIRFGVKKMRAEWSGLTSPIDWLLSNLRFLEYISRLPEAEQAEIWDIVALKIERFQLDYDGPVRRSRSVDLASESPDDGDSPTT